MAIKARKAIVATRARAVRVGAIPGGRTRPPREPDRGPAWYFRKYLTQYSK